MIKILLEFMNWIKIIIAIEFRDYSVKQLIENSVASKIKIVVKKFSWTRKHNKKLYYYYSMKEAI